MKKLLVQPGGQTNQNILLAGCQDGSLVLFNRRYSRVEFRLQGISQLHLFYCIILLTKIIGAQNGVALSYQRVRWLCFLAVIFAMTIYIYIMS